MNFIATTGTDLHIFSVKSTNWPRFDLEIEVQGSQIKPATGEFRRLSVMFSPADKARSPPIILVHYRLSIEVIYFEIWIVHVVNIIKII
jgi:hypothetical protein